MMKIVLTISVLFNLVLGYLYLTQKPKKEIVEKERLIIETHAIPSEPPAEVKKSEPVVTTAPPDTFSDPDVKDASEKMEAERSDFITGELGLSEEKIIQHQKLREQYYKEQSDYFAKLKGAPPGFSEKRKLVDMEEKFHQKLERLYGKENW